MFFFSLNRKQTITTLTIMSLPVQLMAQMRLQWNPSRAKVDVWTVHLYVVVVVVFLIGMVEKCERMSFFKDIHTVQYNKSHRLTSNTSFFSTNNTKWGSKETQHTKQKKINLRSFDQTLFLSLKLNRSCGVQGGREALKWMFCHAPNCQCYN